LIGGGVAEPVLEAGRTPDVKVGDDDIGLAQGIGDGATARKPPRGSGAATNKAVRVSV
jgi:hypothetical protein